MTYAQTVNDPTAVMGRRIGAYLIDGFIGLVLLLFVLGSVLSSKADTTSFATSGQAADECQVINDTTRDAGTDSDGSTSTAFDESDRFCVPVGDTTYEFTGDDIGSLLVTIYLVSFLSGGLNTVVLQGLTGASIGKFLTGLRVVREDGRRVGFGWNLLRQLLSIVDGLCLGIVGLIVASTSKGHRRVGDMAASTYVVRKTDMGTPIQVPGVTHQAAWPGAGPGASPQGIGGAGQAPGGWAAPPTSGPTGTWAPSGATDQLAPSADGPTWDAARDAYIQYDHDQAAWLQWSDDARSWRPIDQ